MSSLLEVKKSGGKIWSHVRGKWLNETPEELVRQNFLCVLVNEYNYKVEQMDEEVDVIGHRGGGQARADFIIWRSEQDKIDNKSPLIIVECKSDNVTIKAADYWQGDSYARYVNAKFFITHNSRETKYWRVIHENMPKSIEEIEDIPLANANDKDIEELLKKLKVFKEDQFAHLLHQCHNVIRNKEKKDPAAAFDEIAKILFIKVWVERQMKIQQRRNNVFTTKTLDEQFGKNPLDDLFQQTKTFYKKDNLFGKDERINLKPSTGREIVKLLERYNLSDTSEDIKGIAFERFLGKTFRGEIGQFFTPRTIVEFMVRMVSPKADDIICDPASGSGGFLIRFFELVKQEIYAEADKEYQNYKLIIERRSDLNDEEKAKKLIEKFHEIQTNLDINQVGTKMWELSKNQIYGVDANDRMARTSKMNMIMHGDGHGGVYHHDGFINVNEIFEERFDIILTNPPFGSSVDDEDIILNSDVSISDEYEKAYINRFGDSYKEMRRRLKSSVGKPITSLFKLPKNTSSSIKTEILFIERCLDLLKPEGRLAIVLPEGVFNNPSLEYVRQFAEDRGYIEAVVSLPIETFYSSGAHVKASILFMKKFSESEQKFYSKLREQSTLEVRDRYIEELECLETILNTENYKQGDFLKGVEKPNAEQKKLATKKAKEENEILKTRRNGAKEQLKLLELKIHKESRMKLKEDFSYPIFMYEADKVGINAIGEEDLNELYPNENQPNDIQETCLELFQKFKENPQAFLEEE